MSDCKHDYQIGIMSMGDECIVYVGCRHCDSMVTAPGVVDDHGGGYSTIGPAAGGLL